jgi:hypothetical protein
LRVATTLSGGTQGALIGLGRAGETRRVKALGTSSWWKWWLSKEGRRRPPIVWVIGAFLFVASFAIGLSLVDSLVGQAAGPHAEGVAPAERPTGESALIEQIKQQVADLRGLEWKQRLPVHVVPKAELAKQLKEANERDPEPEPSISDETLLKLLGLIPQDTDLPRVEEALSRAQVIGFYEPDRKEIFVAQIEGGMDPQTMMTIAHELDHALTDQNFGFGARLDELDKQDRSEEVTALRALVEGDARHLEYAWADRYLTQEEQIVAILGGGGEEDEGAGAAIEQAPRYLLDSSSFPYDEGEKLVDALYKRDGWDAVNQAYREPPRSTAEVLHPDLYPAQPPNPPGEPRLEGSSGCQIGRTGVLGEFDMTEVLEMQPITVAADQAVAGWRGDTFAAARCGSGVGLVLRWRSADQAGAQRLTGALDEWAKGWSQSASDVGADGRFAGRTGAGRVTRDGDVVNLLISRDAATANRLSAALAG